MEAEAHFYGVSFSSHMSSAQGEPKNNEVRRLCLTGREVSQSSRCVTEVPRRCGSDARGAGALKPLCAGQDGQLDFNLKFVGIKIVLPFDAVLEHVMGC